MAGVEVTFDTKELVLALRKLASRADYADEFMTQLGAMLEYYVNENFEKQGGHSGQWAPLSDATLDRRKASESPQILKDTGILYNSIFHESGVTGEGGDVDGYAFVGTPIEYALFHVTGTKWMPARDFLDVDIDKIVKDAALEIAASIAGG